MSELIVTHTDSAVDDFAHRHANWNFWVSVIDTVFIMLGLSIVARDTVMPVLVRHLTDSKLAIGLIPAIFNLGMYLPQLLIANFSERLRYKLPYLLWLSAIFERGPYLLLGLIIWWWAQSSPTLTLILFYGLLATTATSIGLGMPAWYDMIAKVIPVERRGRYAGVGHAAGALLAVIGAAFVGYTLETVAYPTNFVLLFLVASAMMALSWVALALTREPPSVKLKESIPMTRYLRQLPTILRRDHNFARYILSRTTIQLGMMASGFYMVYGIEHFAIDGAAVGLFTGVLVGVQAVMSLVWGALADRIGYKAVLTAAAFVLVLAPFSALMATSQTWLLAPFVILGIYTGADSVASLNIILEFSVPEERPTYIGLINTLLAPVLTLGALLGGWLVSSLGYQGLFICATLAALSGGLLMLFWVQEPRK